MEWEFCLLGSLQVRSGPAVLPSLPGKQRVLLAALLLGGNRMVSLDELTEALWGSEPPATARGTLRDHVKELRKSLSAAGGSRISTVPGGYLLRLDAGELDISRFQALQADARALSAQGAWEQASARLRAALSLWRGEPLADIPSEWLVVREVPRLTEMHLTALESRLDADLRLGRHAEVIGELRQLTALHPMRERLRALLMLALYRAGQQAASHAIFRDTRDLLIEELGVEPGPELQDLHQKILAAEPRLASPASGNEDGAGASDSEPGSAQPDAPAIPRQLPALVRHFTGRSAELAELTKLVSQPAAGDPAVPAIAVVTGTAGVGKTALAVRLAHQLAQLFPDGQLYVNLRGYDPGQPMTASDVLAAFLRGLGVPGHDIPAEADERAARYRSLLAGRRMLVLLDNAGSVEQVRPLLPGTPACAVVVTSRDALPALIARDGAQRLDLDLLPLADAVTLLRELIGSRVDEEPGAAEALAARCARLPLALRVAAELAACRSTAALADLTGELAGTQRRLDLLDAGGDSRTAVRAVFSWSCRHLDDQTAAMFRLLGLHPGPDLEPYAAAALAGTSGAQTERMLDRLARAHLIQRAGSGRASLHDLLSAYARDLAVSHDSPSQQRAALTRLLGYYLDTAATAVNALYPADQHLRPAVPVPATPSPVVGQPDAARKWLDANRAALVAAASYAADHGWPGHASGLAAVLFRYLDGGGYYPEALAVHGHARDAARRSGNCAGEGTALNGLGCAALRQGRCRQAASHFRRAITLCGRAGDLTGQARALVNLGNVELHLGHYQQAAAHHLRALALYSETGDQFGEIGALNNLGLVHERQGSYQRAAGHLGQALSLAGQTGNRWGEAYARSNLGLVELRCGRVQSAAGYLRRSLALFREVGDRSGEAGALNRIGELLLADGRPDDARAEHAGALAIARQTGDLYSQASAHDGLASSYRATGDLGRARQHWQEALARYASFGAPEADRVRGELASQAHSTGASASDRRAGT